MLGTAGCTGAEPAPGGGPPRRRYAKEPYIEMAPTAPGDPLSPPGEDALSMDVRSASFGGRPMDFKIQFVPPCFIRYYIPSPMARAPHGSVPEMCGSQTRLTTCEDVGRQHRDGWCLLLAPVHGDVESHAL